MTQPTPEHLGIWILCAIVSLNFALTAIRFVKTMRGDAERREVTVVPHLATKTELNEHVKENRKEHALLQQRFLEVEKQIRVDQQTQIGALHEKINGVTREVSELSAATEIQTQHLIRMEAKLDRIAERES